VNDCIPTQSSFVIYTQFGIYLGDKLQNSKKVIIAILAVLMLGITLPTAAAQSNPMQYQHSAGIVALSTDSLEIRIVGANTSPHFHWWSTTDPSIDYHMKFVSLFEANDTDSDVAFTRGIDTIVGPRFMLPLTNWEFSGFQTDTDGENITAVHFNFTTVEGFDPRPEGAEYNWTHLPSLASFDLTVQIRVHLYMDSPSEVKFDVIIDGWNWTYDNSILVFQFVITESNHGAGQPETAPGQFHRTETKFQFSNGYMEYEPTALAANNSLQVKASYGESVDLEAGESVYLAFENFGNETLVYDPTIGVESTSGLPLLDTPTLYLIGGVVSVVVIVAIALRLRR
jgi:hypothetical protein